MVIKANSNNKFDVYKRIAKKDTQAYLNHEIVLQPRFYAEDYIDFKTSSSENGTTNHTSLQTLTITTNAVFNCEDGDLIYDVKNDILWKIQDGGVTVRDEGTAKKYSLRPQKTTFLSLVRLAVN